eukprot:SAG22_NODE_14_length_33165_cov_13.196698_4_plen_200_part_00
MKKLNTMRTSRRTSLARPRGYGSSDSVANVLATHASPAAGSTGSAAARRARPPSGGPPWRPPGPGSHQRQRRHRYRRRHSTPAHTLCQKSPLPAQRSCVIHDDTRPGTQNIEGAPEYDVIKRMVVPQGQTGTTHRAWLAQRVPAGSASTSLDFARWFTPAGPTATYLRAGLGTCTVRATAVACQPYANMSAACRCAAVP